MTALTDKPKMVEAELETAHRRNRSLTTWVMILAVLVAGLGVWVAYDLFTASETAATGEIETLLDDYTTAWNTNDAAAFRDLVTPDFTHRNALGELDATSVAAMISTAGDFTVERIGEPIMAGEGYVAQANHLTGVEWGPEGGRGISTFEILDVDGALKIHHHSWVGD